MVRVMSLFASGTSYKSWEFLTFITILWPNYFFETQILVMVAE